MDIQLSCQDLVRLAANRTLEKDGVKITFGRPVLSEVVIDSNAKTGKVLFFLISVFLIKFKS